MTPDERARFADEFVQFWDAWAAGEPVGDCEGWIFLEKLKATQPHLVLELVFQTSKANETGTALHCLSDLTADVLISHGSELIELVEREAGENSLFAMMLSLVDLPSLPAAIRSRVEKVRVAIPDDE